MPCLQPCGVRCRGLHSELGYPKRVPRYARTLKNILDFVNDNCIYQDQKLLTKLRVNSSRDTATTLHLVCMTQIMVIRSCKALGPNEVLNYLTTWRKAVRIQLQLVYASVETRKSVLMIL